MVRSENFIPTRASLLSRLKDWEDESSWRDFFNIYWKLIYGRAINSGLNDAEAQDVVQETIISVSKSMPGFKYNPRLGSFKSWLLKLTHWRIKDQVRKRRSQKEVIELPIAELESNLTAMQEISVPSDLENQWEREYEQNLMDAAMERVKNQVDPKHFQIFDLYVLKELPVKRITAILSVRASTVYLVKHRLSRLIRNELSSLQKRLP